jgi:hypothetical protein
MANSGTVSIAVCGSNIHLEIVSVLVGSLGPRLFSKQLLSQSRFGHRTGHARIIGLRITRIKASLKFWVSILGAATEMEVMPLP